MQNGWRNIWLESDSTSVVKVYRNSSLVLVMLCNKWHNALHLGFKVISSHIYREGNCYADKLANMGHFVQVGWLLYLRNYTLISFVNGAVCLTIDFHSLLLLFFFFSSFVFLALKGFVLVPPLVHLFLLFLIKYFLSLVA